VKIGVCLPYMERDYGRQDILDWCRAIDQGPFSSLSCGERITGYTLEMRTLLAAAAAVTERVRIIPSLYVLPMHSAVWAAKEIATLDQLSAGRVSVTVGVGGRENDYQAVGASFKQRHQRLDDQIHEMRRIWRGEPPFEGADAVGPAPFQENGPPILAGAMGPKAIARASHWADGLYGFSLNGQGSEVEAMINMANDAWQASERQQAPYKIGGFWYSLADNSEARLKEYVFDYLKIDGDNPARQIANTMTRFNEDAVTEAIESMAEAGCDELFLVPATADLAEIERTAALVERLGYRA